MKEINDFLGKEDFTKLNEYARELDYTGIVNTKDGVLYPDINAEVPELYQAAILQRLFEVTRRRLKINDCFFRLTTEDTPVAPHQVHTDTAMAEFTFILYMQDAPEGVKAGTSLLRHKTVGGLNQDPWTGAEQEAWERDHSDHTKWDVWRFFDMEANKGVFYQSKWMHRAEPIGGFGKGIEDGRLVLTAFLGRADGKV